MVKMVNWSKIFHTPPAFDALVRESFIRILRQGLVWKNQNIVATDGVRSLRICLLASTQYTNVTDGQTDTTQLHRLRN